MDGWMIMYHHEPRKDTKTHGLAAPARLPQLGMVLAFLYTFLYLVLFLFLTPSLLFVVFVRWSLEGLGDPGRQLFSRKGRIVVLFLHYVSVVTLWILMP